MNKQTLSVREQTRLSGTILLITARTRRQDERLQHAQIGELPDLNCTGFAVLCLVHGGIGRDNAVDSWQQLDAVGSNELPRGGWIHGAAGPEHLPAVSDFYQTPAVVFRTVPSVILERRQHVAIRQPKESVRMHIPAEAAERRNDARFERFSQVENPGTSGLETIGHQ